MDILFVNPINFDLYSTPQVGQLILHEIVKKKYESAWVNFDILHSRKKISYSEDMNENIRSMVNYIIDVNPKIVGFYTICNSFDIVMELSIILKYRVPHIKIIFGGPHASVLYEDILKNFDCIDAICIGESEKTILPLIDAIINDNLEELKYVQGIAYKNQDKSIIVTEPHCLISEKEIGDYSIFDFEGEYEPNPDELINIEGGRGCPFSCTFCSTNAFWGRKHRLKPIEGIINEMEKYHKNYGTNKFSIVHDHFTANRKYILEFCNKVKKYSFEWACSSRLDVLDNNLLDELKAAGCTKIYIGIESGSKRMQKIIKKNLNLDKAIEILQYAKKIGFFIITSFIYCFPEEKYSDFVATAKMIEECLIMDVDLIQLHKYCLYAGSEDAKLIDRSILYFDETELRPVKLEKNAFTSFGLDLVKKYPSLFIQFYTFDTEVTENFKYFEYLLFAFSSLRKLFPLSIKRISRNHTLVDIYNNEINLITDCTENNFYNKDRINMKIFDTNMQKKLLREMTKIIQKLSLENKESEEIFKYENICFNFLTGANVSEIYEFKYDINSLLVNSELVERKTYIRLLRENEKLIVEDVPQNVYKLKQFF